MRGLQLIATYRLSWLRQDLVAGLVLTTLLVPQGMAYAELAGLPAITGLYTTILCLLGYAVFGPSRILVLGPDSSLGPDDRGDDHPDRRVRRRPGAGGRAGLDARALVGAIMIVAGLAKLGFIADLLSKPTQIGYMNGLALTILVGQLPKLFGSRSTRTALIDEARGFVDGRRGGRDGGAPPLAIGLVGLGADPRCSALAAAGARRAGGGGRRDRRGGRRSTSPTTASRSSAACRRASRRSPCPSRCLRPAAAARRARRASRWSRWPTPSRPPRRSPRRRPGGRRQPGDDRHRRGEPRRRAVPGLPREHQRIADGGRRAGRARRRS